MVISIIYTHQSLLQVKGIRLVDSDQLEQVKCFLFNIADLFLPIYSIFMVHLMCVSHLL